MSLTVVGPALVICPECGEEIGRERLHTDLGSFLLPLPRTCPACDAALVPQVRHMDPHQAKLPCDHDPCAFSDPMSILGEKAVSLLNNTEKQLI